MCKICRKTICPSGCPNAAEPEIYDYCEECDAEIYDGDEFYKIGDHIFCEACVRGGYRTAEVCDEGFFY